MDPAPFSQRLATYIGSDRAAPVKHVFTMLAEVLEGRSTPPRHVLDIGCASGDLLAYVGSRFANVRLTGVDLSRTLVDTAVARAELARATLVCADGIAYRGPVADVVTCFGMLGIFDDFEQPLTALLANRAPGGCVVVHALFNPDDIDVYVKYRDNAYSPDWQGGFNIFSRDRIVKWLAARGLTGHFLEVRLPVDLPKRTNQPHRAHTVMLENGDRRTINGLCQLLPEAFLIIKDAPQPTESVQ